ncbi:MAG: hypothetical protein ABIZ56_07015 [Chthoniobacteraceae bacterium]
MALRLNLNHEILHAARLRKRDPLKLSIMGLCFIAACFACYYFFQLAKMGVISQEYAQKKGEFDAIAPKAAAAKLHEDELALTIRAGENMLQRIEGRFYWAPMIEQLVNAVPPEVQITKLSGDVQGDKSKKCRLTIDGLSAGTDPRKVAEELRTSIAESFGKKYKNVTSSFRSLEDGVEIIQVNGAPSQTATFAINVEFQGSEEIAQASAPYISKKK